MSSVYVVCWIFLQTFQTYFCIQANSVDPDQTFKITSRWQSRRQLLWPALWRVKSEHISYKLRLAKIQISLRIRAVFRVFAGHSVGSQGSEATDRKDWSESAWADAQADMSLYWVHMHYCWICCGPAQYNYLIYLYNCFVSILNNTKTRLFKYIENFITKQKRRKFSIKNSDIFHFSAQNIDCGYSSEPLRRGGSNEYPLGEAVLTSTHNLCFWAEIRKIMYTPVNRKFFK